jgi:O-antigen/teichoic acid export membrane protein
MLFTEHAWLFLRGLLVGAVAGLVAVLPAITTPGSNPALGELSLVLGAVLVNGLLWIWIAAHRALRTPLIPALRGE